MRRLTLVLRSNDDRVTVASGPSPVPDSATETPPHPRAETTLCQIQARYGVRGCCILLSLDRTEARVGSRAGGSPRPLYINKRRRWRSISAPRVARRQHQTIPSFLSSSIPLPPTAPSARPQRHPGAPIGPKRQSCRCPPCRCFCHGSRPFERLPLLPRAIRPGLIRPFWDVGGAKTAGTLPLWGNLNEAVDARSAPPTPRRPDRR